MAQPRRSVVTWQAKSGQLYGHLKDRDPSMVMTLEEFQDWLWSRATNKKGPFWLCSYCPKTIGLADLTVDHVLALALGGESTTENFAESCRPCNEAKGELGAVEFMQVRRLTASWVNEAKTAVDLDRAQRMGAYLWRKLRSVPSGYYRKKQSFSRKGAKAAKVRPG